MKIILWLVVTTIFMIGGHYKIKNWKGPGIKKIENDLSS